MHGRKGVAVPRGTDTRPSIRCLTRREFLSLTAAVAGGAVLAGEALAVQMRDGTAAETAQRHFKLPEEPNQNPAFMARAAGGGGLLLWRQGPRGKLAGFRLNASGRVLWRLCDGSRNIGAIGAEYARRIGRPAAQGAAFVARLLELGVIVSGATVVPGPEFPTPPAGGCYHRRIEAEDPVSG
jgi:hypothetical protein